MSQIKPILTQRCVACHGVLKQEAGLRLDTAASAIRGGDSGAAIAPGVASASLLWQRVSASDLLQRMPPEGEPLSPEQIAAIERWIAQNAEAPAGEQPDRDPRDHWAFQAPVRPNTPLTFQATSNEERWSLNPIDAFIAEEYRVRGLTPQRPADRRAWLRRVSLDLVGVPPTIDELEDFVADPAPDAYERVAERLLESPRYGQRWGRHWMDIWRYSDWWGLGAEVRNSQKHIWHWRDWIVESLNADKGYDQMLREMLAADEIYPNDLDRLRATGYLARQYFIFNRTSWLDETIEHTAKGMLGLTFNCAKCHDHKYDPLTQVEYYKLRAIFEPYQIRAEMVPGQTDFEKDGIPRAFDAHLDEPTYLHIRGDDRQPDKTQVLSPDVPAFLTAAGQSFAIEPVSLPIEATYPGLREHAVAAHRQSAVEQVAAAQAALLAANEKLAAAEKAQAEGIAAENASAVASPSLDRQRLESQIAAKALNTANALLASIEARAAADRTRLAPDPATKELALAASKSERVLAVSRAEEDLRRAELALAQAESDKKAEFEKKVTETKAALEALLASVETPSESFTPLPGAKKTQEDYQNRNADSPYPAVSSGRRTAFAKWLTDRRNPLAARVAVNHIWMRHLGRPLAPAVFDFGRKSAPPTHPQLLDWLACELMENDWSVKHIHRLIVTSQTYRLSSSKDKASEATIASDPENRYYWRMNPVRMDAQVVRDSLLSLAGELDLSAGGPPIPIADETSRRRSMYFTHSHNDHQKFLSTFDDANVLECYRRTESIVPQQALAMENSPLAAEMAAKIAERLAVETKIVGQTNDADDAAFANAAFVTVLSVEPSTDELATMLEVLSRMKDLAAARNRPNPEKAARTSLVQALLNHNDFLTIR